MFNNLNLSNALALIDKPVWVITEVRGRNKNNRTYSKSRSKNVIYPATITNVQVWRGYSHSKGDTGCPKCTVTVDIATKDDTGAEIYFDLPNELLNVTVFESKEDAEKELAYLVKRLHARFADFLQHRQVLRTGHSQTAVPSFPIHPHRRSEI